MSFARSFLPLALIAPISLAAPVIAAAPAPLGPELTQVQAHLRAVSSMTADFVQTNSKGQSVSGTLQLKKPGKVRFQYEKGVPLLVVGDGHALTVIDYSVKQVQRWPIGNTPLSLLLDPNKDIGKFAKLIPSGSADEILLTGQDAKHREYGSITVGFRKSPGAPGGLILEGWTVLDAQNNRTTVRLSNPHFNVPIDDSAFRWNDPRPQGRH
jgi:outer membrane lipoprotein-sorting protein